MWNIGMFRGFRRWIGVLLSFLILLNVMTVKVKAQPELSAPAAILIEATTGKVIYEKNADERRSPASITKIMTLLIVFDRIHEGKAKLDDEVLVSENAASMGGSQVYLAQGEVQTLDTMIKCIAVASGNDASVAVAEYIAGSEDAFVKMMNDKAKSLGMTGTHFVDCCGLTTSDEHYTTAKDVARMSSELITSYPEVLRYTGIWMEDITHKTRQGISTFTLSSTNKLLKRYPYTTGLKTGSTQKAKYCISASASKDGMDLIAVILGAPDPKARFSEAQELLTFGYSICRMYRDETPPDLPELPVNGGIDKKASLSYDGIFQYFDLENLDFQKITVTMDLPEEVRAPLMQGDKAGRLVYSYDGVELGEVDITFAETIERASLKDYIRYILSSWLLP